MVLDQVTGERLTSPHVMLYRIGIPGETLADRNEDGSFSFTDISEGEYSLATYDPRYAPVHERLTLISGDSKVLELRLTPGGFLSGEILDYQGQPPERSWFSLFRSGERKGKSGTSTIQMTMRSRRTVSFVRRLCTQQSIFFE